MSEILKKYRVKTIDGGSQIVLAKNIHDAKSKARIELGQLPNEVNLRIVNKVLDILNTSMIMFNETTNNLKKESKVLNWDEVYTLLKESSERMLKTADDFKELAGSMVKIKNKEENK